jgi:CDP-4-dehydro-6-deoxyglucose reductase
MRARLIRVESLTEDVLRIRLACSPGFSFAAGQYLRILHPDGRAVPFSIASAPERLPEIELHFRPQPGAPEDAAAVREVLLGTAIDVDGPFGDVVVRAPTPHPLVLVAGGTGVGQCLGILEHLARSRQVDPVHLLWSVSAPGHLYGIAGLESLAARHRWFSFDALVDADDRRSAACTRLESLTIPANATVIVSGGPGFVYAVIDTLATRSGRPERVCSDVFAYAPR